MGRLAGGQVGKKVGGKGGRWAGGWQCLTLSRNNARL